MELNWVPNLQENLLTFEIDNLKYTTIDGGQNIKKYIDGVYEKTIRQFPGRPLDWIAPSQQPPYTNQEGDGEDEWFEELDWLISTYSEELGEKHLVTTYRLRDGNLWDAGRVLGNGANNLTDLISVNRLGQPASVQERWDWEPLANYLKPVELSENGLTWSRNIHTGEIWRHGNAQHCPCHVFPKIVKPVQVFDLDADLANYPGAQKV